MNEDQALCNKNTINDTTKRKTYNNTSQILECPRKIFFITNCRWKTVTGSLVRSKYFLFPTKYQKNKSFTRHSSEKFSD